MYSINYKLCINAYKTDCQAVCIKGQNTHVILLIYNLGQKSKANSAFRKTK